MYYKGTFIYLKRTALNRVLLYMNNLRFYLNRGYYCTALLKCTMPELLYGTKAQDNPNPIDSFLSYLKNEVFNNTHPFGKYCGTQ